MIKFISNIGQNLILKALSILLYDIYDERDIGAPIQAGILVAKFQGLKSL